MKIPFVTAAVILLVVWGSASAEPGQKAVDEIKRSVERSALPQEAKETLLAKAREAVNAGIQPDDIAVMVSRGLDRGVDGKVIAGFLDTAVEVKAANLPVRPVLDRIEQGLSKGVPPERIFTATKRLAEKLADADGIVSSLVRSGLKAGKSAEKEAAVQTVARALERSVPEEVISQTGVKARKQNYSLSLFERAVDTVTTLAENGVPVNPAARLVQNAVDSGYSEKELLALERDILSGLREGRSMDEVIKRMESPMERRDFERDSRGLDREQMPGGSGWKW